MINKTIPLCSTQYERMFNTTRIPGIETGKQERTILRIKLFCISYTRLSVDLYNILFVDKLVQAPSCNYIVVYNKGKYFKVYTHKEGQLLKPRSLEQ